MMKAAIYTRVSTDRQETLNQSRQLLQFAKSQGWQVVKEYRDAVTGSKSNREQFQKMFQAASRHEFDIILFWSLDRFSREGVVETLNHLQRLTSYGVLVSRTG